MMMSSEMPFRLQIHPDSATVSWVHACIWKNELTFVVVIVVGGKFVISRHRYIVCIYVEKCVWIILYKSWIWKKNGDFRWYLFNWFLSVNVKNGSETKMRKIELVTISKMSKHVNHSNVHKCWAHIVYYWLLCIIVNANDHVHYACCGWAANILHSLIEYYYYYYFVFVKWHAKWSEITLLPVVYLNLPYAN